MVDSIYLMISSLLDIFLFIELIFLNFEVALFDHIL